MSLIICPECKREISDKVIACPHCGYPLAEVNAPDNSSPQKVEITGVKVKKSTKKIVIISALAIVLILAAFFVFKTINDQAAFDSYIDNLNELTFTTILGGSDAESLCNLTYKVWNNAIYEESDYETDIYTQPDGIFVSDFNTALMNLYIAEKTKDTISRIENNQNLVKDIIKKLQNPPADLEKQYETATSLYNAYNGLTDLAINPSGSLQTFSQKKQSLVDDFMKYFKQLNDTMPEKFVKDKAEEATPSK